jgi:hypothetical protein
MSKIVQKGRHMAATRGTVRINDHTIELPEAEARELFLAAVAMTRRTGALTISSDVTVAVTSATHVSITIPNGFADQYNPSSVIEQASRGRGPIIA